MEKKLNMCSVTGGDKLEIPNGVEMVAPKVMGLCDGLREVVIPGSVRYIGGISFESCKSLRHVEFSGPGMAGIGNGAFRECSLLEEIVIPEGCVSIGNHAFDGCKSLKKIIIPESVTEIGNMAFDKCSSLTNITIPESVTEIGTGAFEWCTSLKKVSLPKKVKLGHIVFHGCPADLEIVYRD